MTTTTKKAAVTSICFVLVLPIDDPPEWWEGHVIHYKEYPDGQPGYSTLNLSARDGGEQQRPPHEPGELLRLTIGNQVVNCRVGTVDIRRPGWTDNHTDADTFDPNTDDEEGRAAWEICCHLDPTVPDANAPLRQALGYVADHAHERPISRVRQVAKMALAGQDFSPLR